MAENGLRGYLAGENDGPGGMAMDRRVCAECGVPTIPGDGGLRAYGRLFCSEECADDFRDGRP